MKRLKGLRVFIIGVLIFCIGCGGYQGSSSIKEVEADKTSVQSQVIGTVSDTKGSDTVEASDEIELLIKKGDIEEKEKILIGQFEGSEWCETNALLFGIDDSTKKATIEWINTLNMLEKKELEINKNKDNEIVEITSDKKWIIYTDLKSSRLAPWLKSPSKKGCMEKGWSGYIVDLYRYQVNSDKKEKIGIIDKRSCGAISPDSKKIFLGHQMKDDINMSEPKWEKLYFKEESWDKGNSLLWFEDSSGIVTNENEAWGDNGNKLFVEIFGSDGWTKTFETGLTNMSNLQVDKDKRFYLISSVPKGDKSSLYQCRINTHRELICKRILRSKSHSIPEYIILPNGDIVFWEYKDKWIRCVSHGQTKGKWVVKVNDWVGLKEVSPDEKWLAFYEVKRGDYFLFIVKL